MRSVLSLMLWITCLPVSLTLPAGEVDYTRDIKPILRARCYACHGALKQQSSLRLDTGASVRRGGDSGVAITPGQPGESLLMERVSASEEAERMPPEGEPLTAAQMELLQAWIAQGADSPVDEAPEPDPREHWAFQPVERPAIPAVARADWPHNPIDAFLARQHEEGGLDPQREAPRFTLVRRLYLDLLGVPPSLAELQEVADAQGEDWYERLVERLLHDPRHGERWARHWMDVWRYSDWWGLGEQLRNSQLHIWHWRDWIVESLNSDLPYDELVRLMLAADELHPGDIQRLRATGFLARNYFLFNRHQWMDETVEHVSKGLLGLTLNCAKCHDHKYDPFEQADYYRLRAFFEPYHVRVDMVPGEPDLARDGIPRIFDGLLETPTYLFVRGQEKQPDQSQVIAPAVPAVLQYKPLAIEPLSLPPEAWQPERRAWVFEAYRASARQAVAAAEQALQAAKDKVSAAAPAAATPAADSAVADGAASDSAAAELRAAECGLAVARAEAESLERRMAAQRAEWERTDAPAPDDALAERARTAAAEAVKAERQVAAAQARQAVASLEVRLLQTAMDKREPVEKELQGAREKLGKAEELAAAEISPMDRFTPLVGAKWTATRFLSSGADDPAVTFPPASSGRRRALADWLTDPRNPLTARVAVNQVWMRHLGAPLVPTVFDFGRKGTPPLQPELLDWLAAEFMESGWSMKHLHRLIVSSAAYRMSSSVEGREANLTRDADNLRWWRRTPLRLESQVVRDSVLSLAGTLDLKQGGPPVPAAQQPDSFRRSLYFFHSNNDRNLFLATFDEAMVKECYRRETSIVPQQALALTNSRLVLDAAEPIAGRITAALPDSSDDAAFVRSAFLLVLGVSPSDGELAASQQALAAWRALPEGAGAQARAHFIWALLNHNDFVSIR